MPLNTWLWWIVAEGGKGYHVGFRSTFDKEQSLHLKYFPRNDSLLDDFQENKELLHLIRFSEGYYTVESRGDTLVFNDLRFGQNGWDNPDERFVFNYYLSHPTENQMVIQRGRFAKWNQKKVESFITRIRGY